MSIKMILCAGVAAVSVACGSDVGAQPTSTPQSWTVTLTPTMNPLPLGGCGPVWMTLVDGSGKAPPRDPQGRLVSMADFDMTVSGANATDLVGAYNGPSIYSACACQSASVGSSGTITATYPAANLARSRVVPGVIVQSSATFTLAPARGTSNPVGCSVRAQSAQAQTAAPPTSGTTVGTVSALSPRSAGPISLAAPVGPAIGNAPFPTLATPVRGVPAVMVLNGSTFAVDYVSGGSATMSVGTSGGAITVGPVTYEPIVVDVAPGGPLDSLINLAWTGLNPSLSGSIRRISTYYQPKSTISAPNTPVLFTGAHVISTTFPPLTANSGGGPVKVRVVFAVGSSNGAAPAVILPPSSGRGAFAQPGSFKLTVAGVQSTGVLRVESFVVGQQPPTGGATWSSTQPATTGALGASSILVTIVPSTSPDWIAWLDGFVKGGVPSALEKSFTLEIMSAQSTRLATIQGSGVGIVALRNMLDVNNNGVMQAELYARQMQLLP